MGVFVCKFVYLLKASDFVYPRDTCLTDRRKYHAFCLDRDFLHENTDLIIMMTLQRVFLNHAFCIRPNRKAYLVALVRRRMICFVIANIDIDRLR